MIRFAVVSAPLLIVLAASAHAGDAALATSGRQTLALWTDGLDSETEGDRLVGLSFGREGAITIEGKVGVQQHADGGRDAGRAVWTLGGAPLVGRHVRLDLQSEGALDSLSGVYSQTVKGALAWTARATSDFTSRLQLNSNVSFDTSGAAASVGVGPEWVLTLRSVEALTRSKTELRAGVDYQTPLSGAPSATAKIELRFIPGD